MSDEIDDIFNMLPGDAKASNRFFEDEEEVESETNCFACGHLIAGQSCDRCGTNQLEGYDGSKEGIHEMEDRIRRYDEYFEK